MPIGTGAGDVADRRRRVGPMLRPIGHDRDARRSRTVAPRFYPTDWTDKLKGRPVSHLLRSDEVAQPFHGPMRLRRLVPGPLGLTTMPSQCRLLRRHRCRTVRLSQTWNASLPAPPGIAWLHHERIANGW